MVATFWYPVLKDYLKSLRKLNYYRNSLILLHLSLFLNLLVIFDSASEQLLDPLGYYAVKTRFRKLVITSYSGARLNSFWTLWDIMLFRRASETFCKSGPIQRKIVEKNCKEKLQTKIVTKIDMKSNNFCKAKCNTI